MTQITWGGYEVGKIPLTALTAIRGKYFRPDAAARLGDLDAEFKSAFGSNVGISSAYRTYEEQKYLYDGWKAHKPNFNQAAEPGFSMHEKALAVDFGSNVGVRGSVQSRWMHANAPRFGWVPTVPSEPWHFDYHGAYIPTPQVPNPEEAEEDMKLRFITADGTGAWFVTNGMVKRPIAPGENQLLVDLGLAEYEAGNAPKVLGPLIDRIPNQS